MSTSTLVLHERHAPSRIVGLWLPFVRRRFRLHIGVPVRVGRSKHSDVQIKDDYVSMTHCEILVGQEGECTLRDMSTNGTFINGWPIQLATVWPGACITVGTSSFYCLGEDEHVPAFNVYTITSLITDLAVALGTNNCARQLAIDSVVVRNKMKKRGLFEAFFRSGPSS